MSKLTEEYNTYVNYYDGLLNDNPDDSNLVGSWGGIDQDNRYRALVDANLYDGASILEVGCGTGGFLEYMVENGIQFKSYCGLDILEKMQQINEKKYRDRYQFVTQNILEKPIEDTYDIVVLCGVFSLRVNDGSGYLHEILRRSFEACEKVMCFNFISSYVSFFENDMQYHNPADVMKFCIEELSPKIEMKHHYWKCDVTCKVYR